MLMDLGLLKGNVGPGPVPDLPAHAVLDKVPCQQPLCDFSTLVGKSVNVLENFLASG